MKSVVLRLSLLTFLVTAGTPSIAQSSALTPDQKKEIGPVIRDYLMENPQVIMEAVEKYRQNQEEIENKSMIEKIKTNKDAIYNDAGSPVIGNPKGDVTLVEFFDYNCGYCKIAYKDVKALVEQDKNLRVVFKEFPILSESSYNTARYALAANMQGKYWEFHQAIMDGGRADDAGLEKISKSLSLDLAKLKTDADSASVKEQLEKTHNLAQTLGITGTPGFVLNDQPLRGHYGVETLQKMIADQRSQQKK